LKASLGSSPSRFVIVTHFMSVTLMNGMPRPPEIARWPDPAALSAGGLGSPICRDFFCGERIMKSKLFGCLSATVLGAAIALATPAMAQRGGGGFGGMHGGGGFGGMHGGVGGGMHFGGGGFGGGGFRGGMVTGRSVFVPGGNRFAGAPFAARSTDLTLSRSGITISATLRSLVLRLSPAMRRTGIGAGARYGPLTARSGRTSAMIMATKATE
jgi:hypothetical protein